MFGDPDPQQALPGQGPVRARQVHPEHELLDVGRVNLGSP
jgi:hypothetical protein